jgi:hypothetical protein
MNVQNMIGATALGLESALAADKPSGDELLAKCKTYTFGQSREPLTAVENWVYECLGNAAERAAAAKALCGVLAGDATFDCKQFVCRQLAVAGTEGDVPAIAPLLRDEKLADMARYVLERIAGEAIDAALLDALGAVRDDLKVGIINTLGERRCAKAVPQLAKLAGSSNDVIARCAAIALGKIGGTDGAKALEGARRSGGKQQAAALANAMLLAAEQFAKQGDGKNAAKLFHAAKSRGPEPQRKAAARGLEALKGTK